MKTFWLSPKSEGRNSKPERNPKRERRISGLMRGFTCNFLELQEACFGSRISGFFRISRLRISDFGIFVAVLSLAMAVGGCTTESKARLREKNAFLAGQNTVLQQQQAQTAAQTPGVTVIGAVQRPQVAWVTGLTLAQAIATANYVGQEAPKTIIITHNGESAAMNASVLLNGTDIPLDIGDVVELR